MAPSLQALLEGILDYAGLFPPAGLTLEETFGNFIQYRGEAEAWMLGRLVCPAARLRDVTPMIQAGSSLWSNLARLFGADAPLPFTVLGRGGRTVKEFLENLLIDLEALLSFRQTLGGRVAVDAFEVKLPEELLGGDKPQELRAVIHGPDYVLEKDGKRTITTFYEAPMGDAGLGLLPALLTALAEDGQKRKGVKFRCGGNDPVPSASELAQRIARSSAAGVPFKFTAGLHHPLRHVAGKPPQPQHGFINVFAASAFACTLGLDAAAVEPILTDEDASHFQFDADGLRWQDHSITTAQIRTARQRVASFGSCSFDEPREDLHRLGWL